ncbi:MAG: M13 family metallopeptidase [Candidatus Thermoplasmatota archaeon]|jgi:predicted metalloendopeptidase|nr:M13 family metallopeptidase [Candidatus Thermoplasmatota archaeon]
MSTGTFKDKFPLIGDDEKPEDPRFSVEYIDHGIDLAENFYDYANGNWLKTHPIPSDRSYWGASSELYEKNRYILGKILEKCAEEVEGGSDNVRKMIGNFYISSMDRGLIDELKFKPIEKILQMVENIKSIADLVSSLSTLHSSGIPVLFSADSDIDEKNSSVYSFYIAQGGLTLPNKEYYILDSFKEIREQYKQHIENMFILYGYDEISSKDFSSKIMDIETKLAKSSRSPVELRDPEKNYNRVQFTEIDDQFPEMRLKSYFTGINLGEVNYVIAGQPEFFHELCKMLEEIPLEDWKIYIKWKVINGTAPYLHSEVESENFDFFHRKLFGQKDPEKRWKTAVSVIDSHMGEALGKIYVEEEFGEEPREKMNEMIEDIKEVFMDRLSHIDWMSEATKEKAIEKFKKFRAKIGYPKKFIDYSPVRIEARDYLGNILRCNEFEFKRHIERVNKPVDRDLWEMTPPTVNAYFSPTENEIVFPAGILQPPFFDSEMDDAVNYGATGGTIAHEITHGFDDEGRKFDADGNIKEWWTEEDEKAFMERAKQVVDLYGSQEALPGLHVNGELTLGENIADLGGVSIAYEALQRKLKKHPEKRVMVDNLTPEQRFFLGWAQGWRMNIKDQTLRWQVSNDPHSPDKYRAELPVYAHEDFEKVFGGLFRKDDPVFKKIKIW